MDPFQGESNRPVIPFKSNAVSLQSRGNISQIGTRIKQIRDYEKRLTQQLNTFVDAQVKEEEAALKRAVDAYNRKMKVIMKDPRVQAAIEQKEELEENLEDLLYTTDRAFQKTVRQIVKSDMPEEEKYQQISDLKMSIVEAFSDDDQWNALKQVIQYIRQQGRNAAGNVRMMVM